MKEITFLSNKTRKELHKYIFAVAFAVITWVLQVSILSNLLLFDSSINLLLISTIYFSLVFGLKIGSFYGIACSFLCTSILYDYIFYLSYPLIGLTVGLIPKNIFSDEMLFFIMLCFILTVPLEILNSWQYSLANHVGIIERLLSITFLSALLNLILSPVFYLLMKFVTNKLKFR